MKHFLHFCNTYNLIKVAILSCKSIPTNKPKLKVYLVNYIISKEYIGRMRMLLYNSTTHIFVNNVSSHDSIKLMLLKYNWIFDYLGCLSS